MQTQPTPSAHVCTPRPERRNKPRNYGRVVAGDGSDPLTGTTPKRDHHAEWNALPFTQQEVQARDQLLAMMDRTAWNSPEALALSYAVAVLTIKIEDRHKVQGGAA